MRGGPRDRRGEETTIKVATKQEKRRTEIAKGALKLIQQEGYSNVTVDDICSAVGIAKGTFYHYFDSKDALAASLHMVMDRYIEAHEAAEMSSDDARENIVAFAVAYARHAQEAGLDMCRVINGAQPSDPYLIFDSQERGMNRVISRIVKEGCDKGQLIDTYGAEELTNILLVMLRGFAFDWCRKNGEYDLPTAMEKAFRLFVRSISK